jgi:hypothetical protein
MAKKDSEKMPEELKAEGVEVGPVTGDLGAGEVQARMDAEQEQGYVGVKVDPTPNRNYTLQGVAEGAPTPETDEGLREEAMRAARVGTLRSKE